MEDKDSDSSSDYDISNSSTDEIELTKNKQQKLTWFERKKKGIVSKAATSSIGKSLFKKYADKETVKLLKATRTVLTNTRGSKIAKKTHKGIIKISVKVLMLYDQKKLKDSDFNSLTFSFRRFCSSIRNHYQARSFDQNAVERICSLGQSLCLGIHDILKPFVSKKTLERIKFVTNTLCSEEFFSILPEQSEFPEIVMVMSHYLTTISN